MHPEPMEASEMLSGELESSPHPPRTWRAFFHLNFLYGSRFVSDDGVEQLRLVDGKEQERKATIRQQVEAIDRKPHGIRQPYEHLIVGRDERQRTEQCVAKSIG